MTTALFSFGPSIIESDALERDPLTNKPLGIFPNLNPAGPLAPASQVFTWAEMTAYNPNLNAEISLNPAFTSTTTFDSLQPGGVPFFPAEQVVDLYLNWSFDGGMVLYNTDPLRLRSTQPLSGFPIAYGPNYTLDAPVPLYVEGGSPTEPFTVIEESEISGETENLFDVQLEPDGPGSWLASVATRDPGLTLPVRLFTGATPGFSGVDTSGTAFLATNTPTQVSVSATPPSEPCFDYIEVWAVSLDPARLGVSFAMEVQPNHPSCPQPTPWADAGADQTAEPGQQVTLDGSGTTGTGTTNYSWVAPTGVTLANATSPNPTFVVPATSFPRELLFTLFVDDGTNVSPADYTVVKVEPPSGPVPGPGLGGSVPGPGGSWTTLLGLISILGALGLLLSRSWRGAREPR